MDSNMVDDTVKQLKTAFSNALTVLFTARLKALAEKRSWLGTQKHQRSSEVKELGGGMALVGIYRRGQCGSAHVSGAWVSLPFLRGILSSQDTKQATQPACHPATQSTCLASPRNQERDTCMVDGNAKMVLNVPTQAPLQQLQQAFEQHARGADYNNTSAKEATRFTREQLRAYLLYHKVPPRDQPVGSTLVAGWQKAVQKHIAERGSPTGHGVLP
ncbi:hypothetical protein QJQ45_009491 [Haematococcus lacustris]|nr:hypothetical protein QJQ45_009491 [Haematococcus lacustris]